MLVHWGFQEVYSLAGGIMAWQGRTALGGPTQGLGLIRGGESQARMLAIAYGLEEGLRRFYDAAAGLAGDGRARELWARLAGVEVAHKDRLWRLYLQSDPPHADRNRLEAESPGEVMEGGEGVDKALTRLGPGGMTALLVLEAAMGVETQALDLYLRMAHKAKQEDARAALIELAEEEKAHLKALGRLAQDVAQDLAQDMAQDPAGQEDRP